MMGLIEASGIAIRYWLIQALKVHVGNRVHQDHVPQVESLLRGECRVDELQDFVFFSRRSVEVSDCLGNKTVVKRQTWDIEIWTCTVGRGQKVAGVFYSPALGGYRGMAGDPDGPDDEQIPISSVVVADQSDDYELRCVPGDSGFEVITLNLETVH